MKLNITCRYQKRCERYYRLSHWHKWFAWYPVRIDTWRIAWLETVERCGNYHAVFGRLEWEFEYREIERTE